jgi:CheY-like chemotaxis protein
VAVLSADATPGQHRRLLAAGAIAYLTKPFDIAEVLRLVDRILASPVQNRSDAIAASGGMT